MTNYTYSQVYNTALNYFNGDELAAKVFTDKYALQDSKGTFYEQSPTEMHRRLAKEFARIEANYANPLSEEEIFTYLSDWTIIPQGSPMSGIGNLHQLQSLSNCFVIEPAQDSYGGIFRADQQQAQIMKRRGGVGHDISNIRPKGLETSNAARTTDGIAVFMDRFSNTTREVAQNGRRGALMLSISCKHPEVETFINIKKDKTRITGANVSIRVTDDFMEAVRSNGTYIQQWPVNSINPFIKREVKAADIWEQMMQAAWESAEPGILFWDTIIKNSPADCYADVGYETSSTNPCGELPLCPFDSCRLLLINLSKFIINPYSSSAKFDYTRFKSAIIVAQRLMDDLVDLELEVIHRIISKIENDPEADDVKALELNLWKKILKVTGDGRRTGLGETALADAMAMLGIRYGSDESIKFTTEVHKALAVHSYTSSIILAKERGAFTVFNHSKEKDHPFVSKVVDACEVRYQTMYRKFGRRNIANLTIAPAGSVSIEAQTSSGAEPIFRLQYKRRKKIVKSAFDQRVDFTDQLGDQWQEFEVYHPGHIMWAKINSKDCVKDVEQSPYWKASSADIDWIKKVEIQSAAQQWIDHSISNTTNIPSDADIATVKQVYMRGWETGCKGITIYREGSRAGVLISNEETTADIRTQDQIKETHAPKRPNILPCHIHRTKVKGEEYLILIGLLKNKPYEVFCGLAAHLELGKKENRGELVKRQQKNGISQYDLITDDGQKFENIVDLFDNPDYGAFSRTLSTSLRHGVPVQYVVEQLRKDKHSTMTSFSSVVARVLSKSYILDGTKSAADKVCSSCASTNLAYQQGCVSCLDCGNAKCG